MAINTSVTTTLDKIIIDGVEFSDYSDYFVLNEKTYSQEPVRSVVGVLDDIDTIPTFVVPRLFISYNYLDASKFRKLLTAITSKNQMIITYYDQNDGVSYTRPFYLKPYSKTRLFTRIENEEVVFKGIRGLELEFVATLRDEIEEKPSEE